MNKMDELNFDSLSLIEVPVTIEGKRYVLREASGDVACKYRNALMTGTQMEGKRVTKIGSMADAEPLLVAKCLFEVGEDELGRKAVNVGTVITWPNRIIKRLFKKVQEISDLKEGDEEANEERAKNEPEHTLVGSD